MKDLFLHHKRDIVIAVGYFLVFGLAFGLARSNVLFPAPPRAASSQPRPQPPDPVATSTASVVNSTPQVPGAQSTSTKAFTAVDGQCRGLVKGNISSSGKVYHLPGGAFYDRTNAEMCFDTEAEAKAAGFRKSSR